MSSKQAPEAAPVDTTFVVAYEVRFPERTSFGMGQRKPKADLFATLENGAVLEIKLPQAAARALNAQDIAVPVEKDDFFAQVAARERAACRDQLLAALERRDLSRSEACGKLARLGFLPEFSEPCVAEAVERRFIDDTRYALSFIDRKKRAGWGRRRIEQELAHRGVSCDELEGYPEAFFTDDDDRKRAEALLARKSVPTAKPFEKLVRHLMGKGFSYAVAAEAARARLNADEYLG